jgi:hypothetical protein
MWVCKNNALKNWGVIDYELIVEDKEKKVENKPKCFKMYENCDKETQ